MIIYLHGYDATSAGNHEKVLQLQFIDDVKVVTYSTQHPKHDMAHLLKEVSILVTEYGAADTLICGVGLGGYWAERIGFLCGIKQALFNPNLHPEVNMEGKIDRPEEYADIATKCVTDYRTKNQGCCLVFLSTHDETMDNRASETELSPYYDVVWDDKESHKFKKISQHLQALKAFKV
ncbi:alpha/beta hydrolase YcfP [Photobacterium nomapromontoriensis]|uniref:alpha/beta hydrolase YcfP n=1 Tax=Photobacterium nomapromontoriensis TaxID=2910237 RepID=UPI003D09C863